MIPLLIDSDNGMGSWFGDVDDGFALCALLASDHLIAAISSVQGNTSELNAFRNNRRLVDRLRPGVECLRGNQTTALLMKNSDPIDVLALGPLTNIGRAISKGGGRGIRVITIVGSHLSSKGKFPPIWPQEFNLTRDRRAASAVFSSNIPLCVVPLDVARKLKVSAKELTAILGPVGSFLTWGSRRWFWRSLVIRASLTIPLWDLVAAMTLISPEGVIKQKMRGRFHSRGWLEYGVGRELDVVVDFERERLWQKFICLIDSFRCT